MLNAKKSDYEDKCPSMFLFFYLYVLLSLIVISPPSLIFWALFSCERGRSISIFGEQAK